MAAVRCTRCQLLLDPPLSALCVNGQWSCLQPECIAHVFHVAVPAPVVRAFNEAFVTLEGSTDGK